MADSRQDLIGAIKDGDVAQVAEVLRTRGLDDEPELKGHLLLVAIEEDQTGVVRLLCSTGPWTNVVRSDDLSSIHIACKYGNVDIIEALLRNGAGVNDQTPEHRLTPLLMAVRWGQRDAVLHLLDAGADPNLTSGRYSKLTTPLHEAAAGGREDILNLLLAARADVNLTNGRRQLVLHLCCKPQCVGSGSVKMVKRLLDCGSTVNTVDADGNCALHLAVSRAIEDGHTQTVHTLCVNGAHLGAYNDAGDTPLHMVAKAAPLSLPGQVGRYVDIAQVLLNFSADLTRTNAKGHTPLQSLLISGFRAQLVDLFVALGSDIDHQDDLGESLFHSCAKTWGMVESVRYLLRQGVNYDTISRKKMSPLSSACVSCYRPTITVLCQEAPALLYPADRIDDITGRPLNYVVKVLDVEVLEYLLRAGYRWTRQEVLYLQEWHSLPEDVLAVLKHLLEKPEVRTLRVSCRDVLRMCMKDRLREKVQALPLPTRLKHHLLLLDI